MNKNFRKTSIATLMSMALLTIYSSHSIAAIGDPVTMGNDDGSGAIAIGRDSHAKGYFTIAIGRESKVGYVSEGADFANANGGVAIGNGATVYSKSSDGLSLGNNTKVEALHGVAIGAESVAIREAGITSGYLKPTSNTSLEWVATHGAVSVGSDTVSRQITGVAAGSLIPMLLT